MREKFDKVNPSLLFFCFSEDQALDRFAMKKFYDDKLGGLTEPSQRRYSKQSNAFIKLQGLFFFHINFLPLKLPGSLILFMNIII